MVTAKESNVVCTVLKAGNYAAIQDFGRFGFRHLGIPYSGALDVQGMINANAALGNPPSTPVIEVFGSGLSLAFNQDCYVSISGASCDIWVDQKKSTSHLFKIKENQTLSIGKMLLGCRVYIAVENGFTQDPIMGSVSTMIDTHLRPLKKGDKVYKSSALQVSNTAKIKTKPLYIDKTKPIRVYPGPEFDFLNKEAQRLIFLQTFTISKENNRMGYRLDASPLYKQNNIELLTSGVLPGTVQLLPNGQLIILMHECQTTGGYPRVLIIEDESLSQVAQRTTGDDIRFKNFT